MESFQLLFKAGAFSPVEIDRLIVTQNQAAAICGLIAFVACLVVKVRQKTEVTPALLGPLIQATLAGGGIIKALFLFFCGFHPEIFPKLSDLPVSLGIASLCVIFLGICTFFTVFSKSNSSGEVPKSVITSNPPSS